MAPYCFALLVFGNFAFQTLDLRQNTLYNYCMDIRIALNKWFEELGRNAETRRAYKRAVEFFMVANKFVASFDVEKLTHEHYITFLNWLNKKHKNGSTRSIYATGVLMFFEYLVLRDLSDVNIEKSKIARNKLLEKSTYHLRTFSTDDVDEILAYAAEPIEQLFENENAKLREYRDKAFILTLADTGLRVHEACKLARGDVDWDKARAVIIGKNKKQGVIRFSERSLKAIKDYLQIRGKLDGGSGKPLNSLPVFAQHSRSSSDRVDSITTKTGRDIINNYVIRVLGDEKAGTITPHTFRHYFVTEVINVSGNVKLAKEMARHSNIAVTDKYAQLNDRQLDQAYDEIFNPR